MELGDSCRSVIRCMFVFKFNQKVTKFMDSKLNYERITNDLFRCCSIELNYSSKQDEKMIQ